jgi:hypothetical protein
MPMCAMAQLVKRPGINRDDMESNPAGNVLFVLVYVMPFSSMVSGGSIFSKSIGISYYNYWNAFFITIGISYIGPAS